MDNRKRYVKSFELLLEDLAKSEREKGKLEIIDLIIGSLKKKKKKIKAREAKESQLSLKLVSNDD